MLILSRRKGESLIIGDDIIVTILDIRGSQVRIGIKAPRYVEVHRQEVYEKIQQGKKDQESRGGNSNAKDEESV